MFSLSETRYQRFVGILIMAIAIRIAAANQVPLSEVDCFSWRITTYSVPLLLEHLQRDTHPPLYYLILKSWVEIAGSSPLAMRGLSVFLGLVGLLVVWLLCAEIEGPASNGPQIAVLVAALHSLQVGAAMSVRMYSLGFVWSGLTAWLLYRALRATDWYSPWWTGYGLAVAAFCYTHYFAFFTVLAQTIFVVGDLALRIKKGSFRDVRTSTLGFVYAGTLAFLLFTPWVPVFLSQRLDVSEGWAVPSLDIKSIESTLCEWLAGSGLLGTLEVRALVGVLLILALWSLWCGGRSAWFFFVQALVPWVAMLLYSSLGPASLLQDRYLTFAHVGLFGLWSITWQLLPHVLLKLMFLALLCSTSVPAVWFQLRHSPDQPAALVSATFWLKEHYKEQDLFLLIGNSLEINRFRYYATRAGLPWLNVGTSPPLVQKGHVNHLCSLVTNEFYDVEADSRIASCERVWGVAIGPMALPYLSQHKAVFEGNFGNGEDKAVRLVLYEKGPAGDDLARKALPAP